MALYATEPGEKVVGPGISRCEYGGFVMTYPPGRMYFVWEDSAFDFAVDVENLLDRTFRSAQFATTARLPNEPPVGAPVPPGFSCGNGGRLAGPTDGTPAAGRFFGCEDVHFTPAYPLTVRKVPVVTEEGLGVGRRMMLTLSCDHRVMDGAMGARFLQDVKRLLEEPLRLLV